MKAILVALTAILNHLFGGPITSLLLKLGIHPSHPGAPIQRFQTLELVVTAGLFLFFLAVRATLSVEKPGKIQQSAEMIHEFVEGQAKAIIGEHGYEPHLAFVTTILLFVVCCNLFG